MSQSLILQIFSLLGAFSCLFAYMGHQLNWIDAKKVFYNLLNAFGSGILIYIALRPLQAGFLLMETIWCAISLVGLYKAVRDPHDNTN